jgi:hypothetical protein
MKAFWSKITVPAALAALVIAHTIGSSDRRPERSGALYWYPSIDTVAPKDTLSPRDTVKKPAPVTDDDDWDDDDFSLFGEKNDTTPRIMARDTMKVPDSLKLTDPFLYRWYVAVKDSLTHRIVVDSLKAAGDSLDWPVIDSLYRKDSTETADARFKAWYASLSKKERRRYEYDKALPAKMHRMDSILQRKDSLKKVRDSITESTPRILETYALPDSLHYKRFVAWKEDRRWGKPVIESWDTTFNYHFHDYPFQRNDVGAAWLGVAGSPVETWNFFKRTPIDGVSWFAPYESWTYSPETLPMFNTKTPYTELEYYGTLLATSSKESDNLRLFSTQNILPQLNIALEFKRHGGNGILLNEETANRTTVVAANWLGRKYLAHGGFIRNRVTRKENGGVQDIAWIRDTLVEVREVAVNLSNASNEYKKRTIFFDQSYRIPFTFLKKRGLKKEIAADAAYRDSVTAAWREANAAALALLDTLSRPDSLAAAKADSLAKPAADSLPSGRSRPRPGRPARSHRPQIDSTDLVKMEEYLADRAAKREAYVASLDSLDDVTTLFIGSSSEYSVYTKYYKDQLSASDKVGSAIFRDHFYLNPSKSADSLRYARLDNRIFLRVQPWSEDFVVSRVEGGIGDRLLSHYMMGPDSYLMRPQNTRWNSVYTYAGVEGKLGKAIEWNALGQYTLLGDERNDMNIGAGLTMTTHPFRRHKKSPLVVRASFETSLKRPDFFQQQFYSNHYRWSEDFGKVSTTKVQGSIDIPKWRMSASAGYALLANNIYYDTLGIARQHAEAMSVLTAALRKDFVIADFLHLDHSLLFQLSSDQAVLPLPLLAMNLRYYIQFNIVRADVMKMQLGADLRANTPWYAPYFNPVTGTFMAQDKTRYSNGPVFDLFMNVQWKRACIFVKWQNTGRGWPMTKRDYFTADRFIGTDREIKLGIYWPFYTMSGKNATLSSKAGSGMSGGGGGRGGGGLGGMMGNLRGRTQSM